MQNVCVSGITELLLYKLFYSIPIFVTTFVVMKKKKTKYTIIRFELEFHLSLELDPVFLFPM